MDNGIFAYLILIVLCILYVIVSIRNSYKSDVDTNSDEECK